MQGMGLVRARGSVVSVSARGPVLSSSPRPGLCGEERRTVHGGDLLYAGVLRMLSTAFPEPHVGSVRWGDDIPNHT